MQTVWGYVPEKLVLGVGKLPERLGPAVSVVERDGVAPPVCCRVGADGAVLGVLEAEEDENC